ncbi:MAG: family N-acetyltransferase [Ramlibacter sp.]|jgi:acetyltransferase|nr:family N-acetyltransferase [Ramlibacter sp.]
MSVRNLEFLFQPASVAVVGASDRPGSVGAVVLRNLKNGGFKGPVLAVNPRHASIDGAPAWPDVASLPQTPDLAVICTPAATVPGLIAQLGAKGTRAAIVLSAGLKALAPGGEGSLEQAMLDAARPTVLRILGPNCIGALVPGAALNASFAPGMARAGKLAFVSQSGALATAMLDWAGPRRIGFSHFISLGDSADVDFGDVLDYLGSDPATRAILIYAESFKSSRKLMSAARAAARNKPVIIVKAGRAPQAARAAASHTGALAGSDLVADAAIRRAGMLRVDTLEALFDAAETLSRVGPLRGDRLALLTNGGGLGVLASDALELGGGTLAVLGDATLAALDKCLPATWSHGNPVDIIGDAPVTRYQDALRILQAAAEVDAVLFMHAPTALVPAADIAAACLPLLADPAKPMLTCWLGGAAVEEPRALCSVASIPGYGTPEQAAAGWLQLTDFRRNQQALQQIPLSVPDDFVPDRGLAQALLQAARSQEREWLDPAQAQQLLEAYGIPGVRTLRAADVEGAVALAATIGFPVALKVISPQVIHKSDVGGVALGLETAADVRDAAVKMRTRVGQLVAGSVVSGFIVQEMSSRPHARELIVGLATDDVFGPVVLFGQGGTDVELLARHAVALPPLNANLARDLVSRSGLAPLLGAHRGRPGIDETALVDTLQKVARMACELGELAELDINPLLADADGVLALDARVKVHLRGRGTSRQLAIRPYPHELEQRVTIGAGEFLLRPIRPEDGERLKHFYAGASPADMRLRFFMTRREVPLSELARYSQIDYDREMTFIALPPAVAGQEQAMAAEVRAVCDPDNRRAEFAIQVGSAWQGRGLGAVLLDKLVRYLRERGTTEIVGECLGQNGAMQALARKAGFMVCADPAADTIAMRLQLRPQA